MTNEEWLASRGFVLGDHGQWVNGNVRAWQDECGGWWACVGTFIRDGGTPPDAVLQAAEAARAHTQPIIDAMNEAHIILSERADF